ncbi:MAG: xylose isomerase domain-containing protein [Erysipelotrichaceae bacterium]|nr:MAG: xylose isomerase domain-containing protein [Erysipelotrichaceae bacterium]
MEYGMPTLLELDLDGNVKLALELGLSFVEINCNVPEFQVDKMDPQTFLDYTKQSGLTFTFHLDEMMSITDPNLKISEAYILSVLESIEFAKQAKIESLTLHLLSGVVFTLPDKKVYVYEKYRDYYLDRIRNFRDRVTQAIKDSKISINIENVTGFLPHMREGIECLLESPVFGLTYDCGHNHRYDNVDWDFIQKHADRIRHMHVHDCKEKFDHQSFGDGDLNIPSELNFAAQYATRAVIEVKNMESIIQTVFVLRTYQNQNLIK